MDGSKEVMHQHVREEDDESSSSYSSTTPPTSPDTTASKYTAPVPGRANADHAPPLLPKIDNVPPLGPFVEQMKNTSLKD